MKVSASVLSLPTTFSPNRICTRANPTSHRPPDPNNTQKSPGDISDNPDSEPGSKRQRSIRYVSLLRCDDNVVGMVTTSALWILRTWYPVAMPVAMLVGREGQPLIGRGIAYDRDVILGVVDAHDCSGWRYFYKTMEKNVSLNVRVYQP